MPPSIRSPQPCFVTCGASSRLAPRAPRGGGGTAASEKRVTSQRPEARQRPLMKAADGNSHRVSLLLGGLYAVFPSASLTHTRPPAATSQTSFSLLSRVLKKREKKQGQANVAGDVRVTSDNVPPQAARVRSATSEVMQRKTGATMAAERKTKLSKNLLRMKVMGRLVGKSGWAAGPLGRGSLSLCECAEDTKGPSRSFCCLLGSRVGTRI